MRFMIAFPGPKSYLMSLKQQIIDDLTAAMKAGEETKKDALRMLKAEIMKEEVAGSAKRELDEAEILKIVKRLIKQRKDSIEQFEKGGRTEMAEKEKSEIEILEAYLPEQMSEEKIAEIVAAKKAALGIEDKSKIGMLIGAVMKEVGDAADGGVVKGIVEKSFE
jgi:uncharacterized protein YqeY